MFLEERRYILARKPTDAEQEQACCGKGRPHKLLLEFVEQRTEHFERLQFQL
jgi:hypothetical protein